MRGTETDGDHTMIDLFHPSYADARRTWLAIAAARGLAVETHLHPLPGPRG
jgi:hypothetical protein